MSQRNPLNERYQNADERKGTTRKSAASAKPVSKAAASVRVEGKKEEPKGLLARATSQARKKQGANDSKKKPTAAQVQRRQEQALRSKYYNPDTPEYKKWRKVWWGMLGGAIATTAASFFLSTNEAYANLSYVSIGLSYVLLITAIIFDFAYLRRLRNEYQEEMIAQERSKKKSAKRKELAEEERRLAKEAEEGEGAQPQEERKLFRGLFTKKRATEAVTTAKAAQVRAAAEAADDDTAEVVDAASDVAEATDAADAAKDTAAKAAGE